MIVLITRFVFVVAGTLGGYAVSGVIDWPEQTGYPHYLVIFIFLLLGASIGYVLGGILGRELALVYRRIEERIRELSPADIALGAIGLLVGLVIAWLISQPIWLIRPSWIAVLTTCLLFVFGAYFGLRVALLKSPDVVRAFPNLAELSAQPSAASVKLVDTSAVIDGRFADLMRAGLLEGDLRVPRFVLAELQTLADSADEVKRARGRRGLDLLARFQSDHALTLFEADYPEIPKVDDKLLRLAADAGASIVTVDHNLTKVARVRGLGVVNLNEAAASLKPAYLPGEPLRIHVVREGKEPGQGVGYLEDGTMVVVQGASELVGSDVEAEVTSVLQTSAGRMIFGRLPGSRGAAEQAENER